MNEKLDFKISIPVTSEIHFDVKFSDPARTTYTLTFEDDKGSHTFMMQKDKTSGEYFFASRMDMLPDYLHSYEKQLSNKINEHLKF